jgi:hypothetical protein
LRANYDPREQRALGNFRQALSMLSLVTTALNLGPGTEGAEPSAFPRSGARAGQAAVAPAHRLSASDRRSVGGP